MFEYVCGLVWLVNIALVVSLSGAAGEAVAFISRAAATLEKVRVPDVVAQYLTILIGIVLPYAVAIAFKQLSLETMNKVLPPMRDRFASDLVTQEHIDLVRTAMTSDLGATPPAWWAFCLDLYLEDASCPALDTLRTSFARAQALMQAALPVSLLAGLLISVTGREWQTLAAGTLASAIVFGLLAKAAVDAHMRWDNGVIFTYLMFRSRQHKPMPSQNAPSLAKLDLKELVPRAGA
jgi:hypothetical protein